MSHRSRRSDDDRDRSHSSHRYYEHRHRRDDSRDRDYYHSRKSSRRDKSRSRYRSSRSRSPSYNGSKSHSRHHHRHSRSRSPGYSSRHHRSRSRSPGHYSSRHNDDYHRSHRSKELPESKARRDSREHSQTKHSTVPHEPAGSHYLTNPPNPKNDTSHPTTDERGPMCISNQINDNSQSTDYDASDEPTAEVPFDPNDPDAVLEEERKRIQRETLERLQKHLESEGKKYPTPKPQAQHPIFANDGSFLEMFKSMQGNMQQQQTTVPQQAAADAQPKVAVPMASTATNSINRFQPINRRRGAKILKTGIVQKQRIIEEPTEEAAPSDSWNAYLKEVKRYKTVTCSDDNITRSLVK